MSNIFFNDFDFTDFWDDDEYVKEKYIEPEPSDELITSIENELGYKLPASYIELMKLHNGGRPNKNCFPTNEPTSWAENHIQITTIMSIGRDKTYSIGGELGSRFMIDNWGYPDIGICICDCPSAGHDIVMLDYTRCGRNGEPEVVHVDQESDYRITFLARDFETFIKGLVSEAVFDTSEEDLRQTLYTIEHGDFSPEIKKCFEKRKDIDFDTMLRGLFLSITKEKGFFALHADKLSEIAYGAQFYLLTLNNSITTKEALVEQYFPLVALSNSPISLGGYAAFFEDWFAERIKQGQIIWDKGFVLEIYYEDWLFKELSVFK